MDSVSNTKRIIQGSLRPFIFLRKSRKITIATTELAIKKVFRFPPLMPASHSVSPGAILDKKSSGTVNNGTEKTEDRKLVKRGINFPDATIRFRKRYSIEAIKHIKAVRRRVKEGMLNLPDGNQY